MKPSIVISLLIVINVLAFLLYGIDKLKAKTHSWRIPENVLLLVAFAGGSLGALLAMFLFRHKTKHKKFTISVPIFFVCQVVILLLSL